MKKTKINFELPCVIRADDYHIIKETAQTLSIFTKTKIKFFEIPNKFDGMYHGVLYTGERPKNSEINEIEEVFYV